MEPYKYIVDGVTPIPVAVGRPYTSEFARLTGLIGWWTIDPKRAGVAVGQPINAVQPRVGSVPLIKAAATGPTLNQQGAWPGADFTNGQNNTLTVATNILTSRSMALAVLARSDGLVDETPNRDLFGFHSATSNSINLRRQNNLWNAQMNAMDGALSGGAAYQLIIAEVYEAPGFANQVLAARARDRLVTRNLAPMSYNALGRLSNSETCRFTIGNDRQTTFTNAWDDGVMEVWAFDGSILQNAARLSLIDAYCDGVYFNA